LFAIPVVGLGAWLCGTWPRGLPAGALVVLFMFGWGIGGWRVRVLTAGAAVQQAQREQQEQEQRETLAMELLMAQPLTKINPARATLRQGEYAYGAIEGGLQPIVDAGTKVPGGRGSKKIVFRTGTTPDGAVSKVTVLATGELVITDQRVIFTGDTKSFAIALDQLMVVTRYSDGFGFDDGKSSYEVVTPETAGRTAFAQALYKITQR
jgi:hypothetical protein